MWNRANVNAIVDARIGEETRDFWVKRLNAAGVPCGRVLTYPEAFEDPQVIAREMIIDVDHPGRGSVKMIGFPIELAEAPCEVRLPAPELGADTDAVLKALGYDGSVITDLRNRGVV